MSNKADYGSILERFEYIGDRGLILLWVVPFIFHLILGTELSEKIAAIATNENVIVPTLVYLPVRYILLGDWSPFH